MSFTPPTEVPLFNAWTDFTPVLPSFYWDVYSAEQRMKHLCMEFAKLVAYSDMLADNINIDHDLITELQEAFQKFIDSGFDDYYKEILEDWVSENFQTIMSGLLGHMLFFGLTDDGYFTAYIPPEWAVAFETDINYESDDYGCLIIKY